MPKFLIQLYHLTDKGYTNWVKEIQTMTPLRLGNVSKRFTLSSNRAKGRIAKDRFAFEQSMEGHDCRKIRHGGDFVVQKRDFFGNQVGEPTVYEVKTGDFQLSDAQEKRKRQLGRSRYKVVRY